MSWYVLLTPLLVLPVLGLLRLVGCSLFHEPGPGLAPQEPPDAEDQDDPDSPPQDAPPDSVPEDTSRQVHFAADLPALHCPLDDDEPYGQVPIQLQFSDLEDGNTYQVSIALLRQDGGPNRSGRVTLESRDSGRPDRALVCFACIRQRTPYRVDVRVYRFDDGDRTELVRGDCTSPGLTEEGALVRFVWNDDGELESTLCLETE